jgi:hypothetical protein
MLWQTCALARHQNANFLAFKQEALAQTEIIDTLLNKILGKNWTKEVVKGVKFLNFIKTHDMKFQAYEWWRFQH